MILHIAPDEKFINSIHWQFEKIFPEENKYFVFLTGKTEELKYVKVKKNVNIIRDDDKSLQLVLAELKNCKLAVLHGLKYFQSRIVLNLNFKIKLLWCFWGGEIYDNPNALGLQMIGIKTKQRFVKTSFIEELKKRVKPLYYFLRKRTLIPDDSILKAAKKVEYIGIVHKEEIQFLKEHNFIDSSAEHVQMTYYPLEFIFRGIENISISGNNILLGNSASLTNNHLEALEILGQFNIEERKIVMPLSYGDKKYAKEINQIGVKLFPKNFEPINSFMPLEVYNHRLSQCNIVIMNHYRQQAVGNIVAMLWMGAKVFLNETNTFYLFLVRIGVHVFSIKNDLRPENKTIFDRLTDDEISQNRKILTKHLSFETMAQNLKNHLLPIINGH